MNKRYMGKRYSKTKRNEREKKIKEEHGPSFRCFLCGMDLVTIYIAVVVFDDSLVPLVYLLTRARIIVPTTTV